MVTTENYLDLLRERLQASYEVRPSPELPGGPYALYASSRLVAGKYILHKAITYERLELNEYVVCRRCPSRATVADVQRIVSDLKDAVTVLVHPSHEHMSSAITGVLVSEDGFDADAAREITRTAFTKNFRFGFYGWCFMRLVGVDLASGASWANRRGKEVLKSYEPGLGNLGSTTG